jgi:Transposase DDE domain group 1
VKNIPTNTHPKGERSLVKTKTNMLIENTKIPVDTFNGLVHIEWDPHASVTSLGQLPFFIEFLKLGGLFDSWVEDCPLEFTSHNAPSKRDILGTLLLSILSGHKRYAHVTSIRSDNVNPKLLGMSKVVSEDSLRRSLLKMEEEAAIAWLQKHLDKCYAPLLSEPWILDMDVTVKVLYGKQDGAVRGYNPTKPGRPSHAYHTYSIGNLRLVLDAEVQAGNQTAATYSAPDLWALLDKIPRANWPKFMRADNAYGTNEIMTEAEVRQLPFLFKLKMTKNVQKLVKNIQNNSAWTQTVQGFEGQEAMLQLSGWSKKRRVIILRQQIPSDESYLTETTNNTLPQQLEFDLGDSQVEKTVSYKYSALVTSLPDDLLALTQHYRDRADSENIFDELKNQWGWGGFTTQDLKRCRFLSRTVALIYNWWNIFVRLAKPEKHMEAITSRPLLLHAIGKEISHAGQTSIRITSAHGATKTVREMLGRIVVFFNELKTSAEQLTTAQRWSRMLSKAVEKFLGGKQLFEPIFLEAPA